MWVMVVTAAALLGLAVVVLAVVAFNARQVKKPPMPAWLQRGIRETNRLLNAQGTPPRFLEKLDQR